jgi:hypothetical protein
LLIEAKFVVVFCYRYPFSCFDYAPANCLHNPSNPVFVAKSSPYLNEYDNTMALFFRVTIFTSRIRRLTSSKWQHLFQECRYRRCYRKRFPMMVLASMGAHSMKSNTAHRPLMILKKRHRLRPPFALSPFRAVSFRNLLARRHMQDKRASASTRLRVQLVHHQEALAAVLRRFRTQTATPTNQQANTKSSERP